MNSYQAKKVPICNFLMSLNIHPIKSNEKESWYISPLTNEKTASFKVNKIFNSYYCFSTGQGWTIIDLVIAMYSCTMKEALTILSNDVNLPIINNGLIKKPFINLKKQSFEILTIEPLTNKTLINYLLSRKINITIAKNYIGEINFTYKGISCFGLCFPNDWKLWYEVRNEKFKGFVGDKKDITTIYYSKDSTLSIFEGFIDFLSYLTYFNIPYLKGYVIILNSTMLLSKALKQIKTLNLSQVYLFLDNDQAGIKAAWTITQQLQNIEIFNKSNLYIEYKDFNDFLVNNRKD